MSSSTSTATLDAHEAIEPPGRTAPSEQGRTEHGVLLTVLTVVGAVLVAALHFRPWQGALLEDWALAWAWQVEGLGGFADRFSANLGRPLHVVPHYTGMVAADGAMAGPYGVLALVAVAQFLLAMWALRPLVSSWWVRWVLGLAVALHPWWVAGDVLRFMPSQVAILGVVVWLGAALRYLHAGDRRWLVLVVVAPALGMLTYQAPAGTLVLASVALAVTAAAGRRGVALVVVTTATVGAVMSWSVVIAPRLSADTYESGFLSQGLGDPGQLLRALLRTLVLHGKAVLLLLVVVVVAVIALGLSGRLARWQVWSLLALALASPLAGLAYASTVLHLNDIERIAAPVGLTLWVIACVLADELPDDTRVGRGILVGTVVATAVGAVAGYVQWTNYSSAQQELIAVVGEAREELPDDATLVVEDVSGRYGDVYLLLPPHLDVALDVEFGQGAQSVLCTATGVVRDHPKAAVFPIGTTEDCGSYLSGPGSTLIGSEETSLGTVRLHAVD
ncbi:hypothetical protein [Candidatus Blastococcus massiliensis]|uniref:hypothetical protein n=1 Tax=Candidatus Blastococcus massiliensis TaxID=1470358 RepID=UPI0004B57CC2|nr:hypothetical protein [Candidatus Blastococcus massiliensis]